MKAGENKLIRFLEGHDKNFVIPVYQRNYDWNKENCKQLFNDLKDVIKNNRKSHFFGSIVYIYNEENDDGQEFIIIDGQQRITTLTLLMLALLHELEEDLENTEVDRELIRNEYLIGKYNKQEKVKLKPIKNDNIAFKALFKNIPEDFLPSNITNNYLYFRDMIKKEILSLSEIFSAIKKLDVVEIRLKSSEDDPQLIFESLNSTGLDLSEADKVRNFVLMRLGAQKQEEYYEKYWNKIEILTKYNVSNFLRDYITFKDRKAPNKSKVYFAFKEYILSSSDFNIEAILQDLLKFAKYYNSIIESSHTKPEIRNVLGYLNKLDMTVAYPFLLELFDDYNNNLLNDHNLEEILSIIESFIVRRVVCDVPTNALNKLFMTLGRDIKKFEDYDDKYVEIFKYILSQKRASQRFPNDEEVREKMILKDIYNTNAKNKLHIFDRLENYNNRERVDLQRLLDDNLLSIEHIMPQTLSIIWKNDLGENFELTHSKYLHTIGNLTFTAYNSELSNKAFEEKKRIKGGFIESKLFLNDFIKDQNSWGEETILKRARLLIEKSIEIWPSSKTDYENERDVENTYSLDDENNFTGEKIKYFQFLGQDTNVDNWRDFFQQICFILFELEATKFKRFVIDEDFRKRSILVSDKKEDLRVPMAIAKSIFIEGNLSAEHILTLVRTMLQKLEIDLSEVNICLRENKVE
jgi:uncharacterized protein with ParB-like and HNH nuclease domain